VTAILVAALVLLVISVIISIGLSCVMQDDISEAVIAVFVLLVLMQVAALIFVAQTLNRVYPHREIPVQTEKCG
jgi:hypothetical protein